MFAGFPNRAQSISDLAASLTDPALELVGRAEPRSNSIETELKLWHALTAELRAEPTEPSGDLRHVVCRAVRWVKAEGLYPAACATGV